VDRVDISAFKINNRGTGCPQYHPRLMLSLLIYCYTKGVFSSRKIERATYFDLGARFITADTHPDHDTICQFRRVNEAAFNETFLEVLKLAQELRLLRVGTVSVDGTKIRANASLNKSIRFDRAKALEKQLRREIRGLLKQAEEADTNQEEDSSKLPKELAHHKALAEKMAMAQERIKERARARAKKEQAEYERKLKAREKREGRKKGRKPNPPDPRPKANEQVNLTDPDSEIMRKSKRSECQQSYNAQAVVDTETMLILGTRVSKCASDSNELVADIEAIPEELGAPETVLADTGYMNGKEVKALQEKGMKVLVATKAPSRRKHDFRPKKPRRRKKNRVRASWVRKMRKEMKKEENKELYRLRKQTVEPVFGIIKGAMGFRQFLLRGLEKVEMEWGLLALAYNMKRLHRMAWGS
jgi:transposase